MARHRMIPEVEIDRFDMTPMIDCTFQLIIFFMIVNDMGHAQMEHLELPVASKAIKERIEDASTLVVNIMKDGTVKVEGRTLWNPSMGGKDRRLEDLFAERRARRQYQETPGKSEWVTYPVLIRADRSTAFEHIQKVLMIATRHGGVTRVQLGAKQETK